MSATSLVFSSLLFLPSTVPLTTNSHVLNVVRHIESLNNFHINHHYYGKSRSRKFQLMCDILMSVTSLVFASKLSMPSTVSSTTNSHILSMVRHLESINNSHVNQHSHGISHLCERKFQLM